MDAIKRFFLKHHITPEEILYISREDGRSVLHLTSGRCERTFLSVRELLAALPKDRFSLINKGVAVALCEIEQREGGFITLFDGTRLAERKNQPDGIAPRPAPSTAEEYDEQLKKRYGFFDCHPFPHLVFTDALFDGEIAPVLRYKNQAAEELFTALPLFDLLTEAQREMILAVLTHGDTKTLTLEGLDAIASVYSPERGIALFLLHQK